MPTTGPTPSLPAFPSVGVFCGRAPGAHSDYTAAAEALGAELAKRKLGLVFGGAHLLANETPGMMVSVGTNFPNIFL